MSEIEVPNVLDLARQNYSAEDQVRAADYLDVDHEDPSLLILLGVAAQLGLNPFLGEINLLPEGDPRSADGGGKGAGKLKPAVGRDGLLKVARNTPGFLALRGNAVCENDSLEIIDDGDEVTIRHAFAPRDGKAGGDEDASKWRGPVIGAWAKLIMEGRPATFYYAPLHEHGPEDRDLQDDEYWRYLSTMALKAAQSYVLRIGIGVTGIIPIDEIREDRALPPAQESMDAEILRIVHSELDEEIAKEVREQLEEAICRANEIEPGSWNPSKVRMRLVDRDAKAVQEVLEEVRSDVKLWETQNAAGQLEEAKPATSIVSIPAEEVTVGMVLLGKDTEAPGRVVHHVHVTAKMVTFMVHDEGDSPPPEGMEGAVGDTVKRKRDKQVKVRVRPAED